MAKKSNSLPTSSNYDLLYSLNPSLFEDPTWLFTQNKSKESAINKLFSSSQEVLKNVLKNNNIVKLLDASGDSKALFIERLFELKTSELKAIFNDNVVDLIKASGESKGVLLQKLVNSGGEKAVISLFAAAKSQDEQKYIMSELLDLNKDIMQPLLTEKVLSGIISSGQSKYGASPISHDQVQQYQLKISDRANDALLAAKFITASSFSSIEELYQYQGHPKFVQYYQQNVLKWVEQSRLDTELVKKLPQQLKAKIFTSDIIKQIVDIDPYVLKSQITQEYNYRTHRDEKYILRDSPYENHTEYYRYNKQYMDSVLGGSYTRPFPVEGYLSSEVLCTDKTTRQKQAEMKQYVMYVLKQHAYNESVNGGAHGPEITADCGHSNNDTIQKLSSYLVSYALRSDAQLKIVQAIMTPEILTSLFQDGIQRHYEFISMDLLKKLGLEKPAAIGDSVFSQEHAEILLEKKIAKIQDNEIKKEQAKEKAQELQAEQAKKAAIWEAGRAEREKEAKEQQKQKEEKILSKRFASIDDTQELMQTTPLSESLPKDSKVSEIAREILNKTYYQESSTFLRKSYAQNFAQKIDKLMESNHYIQTILEHAASNDGSIIIFDKSKVWNIPRSETLEVKGKFNLSSNTIYIAHTSFQTLDFEVKTFIHEATHQLLVDKYHNLSKPYSLYNHGQADHVEHILEEVKAENGRIAKRLAAYPVEQHTSEMLSILVDEVVIKRISNEVHDNMHEIIGAEAQLVGLLDNVLYAD